MKLHRNDEKPHLVLRMLGSPWCFVWVENHCAIKCAVSGEISRLSWAHLIMDYLHSFCQPICQNVKTLRKIAPNFYGLPRKPELYSPTNCTFFSWPVPLNSFGQRSCLLLMMKVGCCSVALIANDLIEKPPALAWMNRIKDLWVMELQMHHAHKLFRLNIIQEN